MNLGLALSGGGVKGIAHAGALKAIEEEKIKIDYISGTSSGSIIATLYAIGYRPDEIYDIFEKNAKKIKYVDGINIWKAIYGLIVKRKIMIDGFNSGAIIEKLINQICSNKNIENIQDVKMPLLIPTVNLHTGAIYVFTSLKKRTQFSDKIKYIYDIDIGKAVRASCSYPGVFSPCTYGGTELVDGGIRENIPWKLTKKMGANQVISIFFKNEIKQSCCENIIDVVGNSIKILSHELSNYELEGADYIIPINTPEIGLLDIKKIGELYKMGYDQTKKEIKKLNIKK